MRKLCSRGRGIAREEMGIMEVVDLMHEMLARGDFTVNESDSVVFAVKMLGKLSCCDFR